MATATALVRFDDLPDAAIEEITAPYKLTGDRKELLAKLRHLVHQLSCDEVLAMIVAMKPIAAKYGQPDAVKYA